MRIINGTVAKLMLTAACACLWPPGATQAAGVCSRVAWRDQRLSVDGAGAPIVQVLSEVARRTGIAVEGAAGLSGVTHAQFANLPLAQALSQLLPGVNFAIVEKPCTSAGACPMTLVLLDNPSLRALQPAQTGAAHGAPEAGITADPNQRLEQIYEAAQGGNLQALKLAATGRNSDATQAMALDLLAQRDPGAAANLAQDAAASSDLGERVTGLAALAHLDSPAAVRVLGKALSDSDSGVKQTALLGLAEQSGPEAARLMSQAAQDPDPAIQSLAKSLLAARVAQTTAGIAPAAGRE